MKSRRELIKDLGRSPRLLRGFASDPPGRDVRNVWDPCWAIKVRMSPSPQLITVFFQAECDSGKTVIPDHVHLIAGLDLPIGRAAASGARSIFGRNGPNDKALLLKSFCPAFWKQLNTIGRRHELSIATECPGPPPAQ